MLKTTNEPDAVARLERERQVLRDNIKNCRAAVRMIQEAVETMRLQDLSRLRSTWNRRSRPRRKHW